MFLIFDLDGTVIDSTNVMNAAFQHAYEAVGLAGVAPLHVLRAMQGSPFPEILRAAGLPGEMHEFFKDASRSLMRDITLHRDVVDCCSRLVNDGAVAAIFTGEDRSRTEDILDYFGITHLFEHVVASDDGLPGKPSPAGIQHLLLAAGKRKHETIMVGDAANDIVSARAAGVTSIGCLWGTQSEASLVRAGADYIVDVPERLDDLMLYIEQAAQDLAS